MEIAVKQKDIIPHVKTSESLPTLWKVGVHFVAVSADFRYVQGETKQKFGGEIK